MRFWVHTYARSATATPSAAISVAAHAVLVGFAVYGTSHAAQELQDRETARVTYMLPVDRLAASAPSAEHLQFIEMSTGLARTGSSRADAGRSAVLLASPRARQPTGRDERSQAAVPLSTTTDSVYSVLTVDETAVRVEGSAAPVYPGELLKRGVEGSVTATYIVDSTGLALPTSFIVSRSSDSAFAQSVRDALAGMRFHPAIVGGRAVRELVEQTFQFRITPPALAPPEHTKATPVP